MSLFDADGNGVVDMTEFQEFCWALPDISWKAEKVRRRRVLFCWWLLVVFIHHHQLQF